jgi:hypothetical protein
MSSAAVGVDGEVRARTTRADGIGVEGSCQIEQYEGGGMGRHAEQVGVQDMMRKPWSS